MIRGFSNFDLKYAGLIDMNLKCKMILALVLAGLLLPLTSGEWDGDHAPALITMSVVVITVVTLSLWRRGEHTEGLRMKRGADL